MKTLLDFFAQEFRYIKEDLSFFISQLSDNDLPMITVSVSKFR